VRVGDGTIGPVTRRIYEVLTGIQRGLRPAPEGWLFRVPRRAAEAAPRPKRRTRAPRAMASRARAKRALRSRARSRR